MERTERVEPRIPPMTARSNWGGYARGMAVEILFILFIIGAGVVLAFVAAELWL